MPEPGSYTYTFAVERGRRPVAENVAIEHGGMVTGTMRMVPIIEYVRADSCILNGTLAFYSHHDEDGEHPDAILLRAYAVGTWTECRRLEDDEAAQLLDAALDAYAEAQRSQPAPTTDPEIPDAPPAEWGDS